MLKVARSRPAMIIDQIIVNRNQINMVAPMAFDLVLKKEDSRIDIERKVHPSRKDSITKSRYEGHPVHPAFNPMIMPDIENPISMAVRSTVARPMNLPIII